MVDGKPRIGDEVYIHGYIDEIRNDVVIIRNEGGYFGTSDREIFYYEEDERGYGTMNEADRKTENSSEKPNNCEKDCFLCKWLGDVDVCGRCRNRNLFAEADTEPTISKMEHVEDEPQVVTPKKCKGCDSASKIIEAYSKGFEDGAEAVKAMPQTDCNGCKFVGTYDTEFPCANCSRKTKDYYAKDEPQTDCGWK